MSSSSSSTPQGQQFLSERYRKANGFLQVVIGLVGLYGALMVTAGNGFAMPLFDLLGFGPNAKGLGNDNDPRFIQYCLFMFGVLGAVIVGWMTIMLLVVQQFTIHPDPTIRQTSRHALIASSLIWFVLDTGYSLVISEVEHAMFNIPFLSLLVIPLYIMSTSDNGNTGNDNNKKGQ